MIDFKKIDTHLFEFTVRGAVTKADIEDIWTRFGPQVPSEGKIKVLEIIEHFEGMSPAAFWDDFKRGWPFINRVSHAAIVADQSWVAMLTNVSKIFVSTKIKTFAPNEIDAARRWIAES